MSLFVLTRFPNCSSDSSKNLTGMIIGMYRVVKKITGMIIGMFSCAYYFPVSVH